jgi:hypothetical protein
MEIYVRTLGRIGISISGRLHNWEIWMYCGHGDIYVYCLLYINILNFSTIRARYCTTIKVLDHEVNLVAWN